MLISCIVVNTKKGEIERTCAIPMCFDVDNNTIKCSNVESQLCRKSKKSRREKMFMEVFSGFTGSTGHLTGTTARNFRWNFRRHFRLRNPLEFTGSCTGSSTGTSGKPEVPVYSAVLPVITSGATSGASSASKVRFCYSPEVAPEVRPELPLNRKYRPVQRYFRSCG